MRIETQEVRIYSIEDLELEENKELKEKVLDKHRYINVEDYSLTEFNEGYNIFLNEHGFLNADISYDVSCCQGSGACFDCKEFDLNLLLKDFDIKHKQWLINIIQDYAEIEIKTNSFGTHYCHSNTRDLNIYFYDRGFHSHNRIDREIQRIAEYLETLRKDLSDELYDMLQKDYDYQISDEAVMETLEANDYEFDESGRIY